MRYGYHGFFYRQIDYRFKDVVTYEKLIRKEIEVYREEGFDDIDYADPEEEYFFVNTSLPKIHMNSSFLNAYSLFESLLISVIIKRTRDKVSYEYNSRLIENTKVLFQNIGMKSIKDKDWEKIEKLAQVRNILTHNDSSFSRKDKMSANSRSKKLYNWLKQNKIQIVEDTYQSTQKTNFDTQVKEDIYFFKILIDRDFFINSVDFFKEVLHRVNNEINSIEIKQGAPVDY